MGLYRNYPKKFKLKGTTDELFFWQSIYGHVSSKFQKKGPPKSYKDFYRNHFRQIATMSNFGWETVKNVGNWAQWRDLLDNKIFLKDLRLLRWVVQKKIDSKLGHKEFRPFLHKSRKFLKQYDTVFLNDLELQKLLKKLSYNLTKTTPYLP